MMIIWNIIKANVWKGGGKLWMQKYFNKLFIVIINQYYFQNIVVLSWVDCIRQHLLYTIAMRPGYFIICVLPTKSIAKRKNACHGVINSKKHVIVLLCANLKGNLEKSWVIGKWKKFIFFMAQRKAMIQIIIALECATEEFLVNRKKK